MYPEIVSLEFSRRASNFQRQTNCYHYGIFYWKDIYMIPEILSTGGKLLNNQLRNELSRIHWNEMFPFHRCVGISSLSMK